MHTFNTLTHDGLWLQWAVVLLIVGCSARYVALRLIAVSKSTGHAQPGGAASGGGGGGGGGCGSGGACGSCGGGCATPRAAPTGRPVAMVTQTFASNSATDGTTGRPALREQRIMLVRRA